MKPNFSVVLIARNEAKTLPRLLESLKDFQARGGEVILVDTGSTDATVAVARSFGVQVTEVGDRFRRVITGIEADAINAKFLIKGEEPVVLKSDSLFDYSSSRNYAASLASNDVIAMPDCDEAYIALDINAINALIADGVQQFEYEFVFSFDEYGNPAIAFRHCKFYDRRVLSWAGIVHEILQGAAKRLYVDEHTIKLGHWQNHETDRSGYLKGLALDCFENPENDRNSHYFGREMIWAGRVRSGLLELEHHMLMLKWPAERAQSSIFRGDAFLTIGEDSHGLTAYHTAINIDGDRRTAWIRLAEYYFRKNEPKRVITYASAALTITQGGFYAEDSAHYRHTPHELLYWAFWYVGDKEESARHFALAQSFMPNHPKYLHDQRFYEVLPMVSIMLPQLGRPEGFKRACESVKKLIYPEESIELLVEEGEGTVPNKVAKMYKAAKGDWIVFASNDIEFTPESLMLALNHAKETGQKLVAFNTGVVSADEGNICEHFIIHRELIEKIGGEIFDTRYWHVGVDNLLWARAKKLDQATRSDDAIVHHYHFSTGKATYDKVYQMGWSKADEDRARLKEDLALLSA